MELPPPSLAEDEELADEDEHELLILAAVLLVGAAESRERRLAQQRDTYLTRAELMPDPRINTPWQQLWGSQNDRAFITTMGVDVDTFRYLLDNGFARRWNSTPIPRSDTDSQGQPCLGRRSLDSAGALGLYLHFLSSSMNETALQQIFALFPGTTSRYLQFSRTLMLVTLREILEGRVVLPDFEEYHELSLLVQVSCAYSRHGKIAHTIPAPPPTTERCIRWHRRVEHRDPGVRRPSHRECNIQRLATRPLHQLCTGLLSTGYVCRLILVLPRGEYSLLSYAGTSLFQAWENSRWSWCVPAWGESGGATWHVAHVPISLTSRVAVVGTS